MLRRAPFLRSALRKAAMQSRLIRIKEVQSMTGKSRSSIYADMAAGVFPASVKIGAKSVAWAEAAISKWIEDRLSGSSVQFEPV